MSMYPCVYFEGNAFIDGGQVQNTNVTQSSIGNCAITTSTLDMNFKNITSVADPINYSDAATKRYVDDLGIVISVVSLSGTSPSLISNNLKGSYVITISNLVLNGPSAVFNVTKSESTQHAHIARTVASPGQASRTLLKISWPPNSGIYLSKTESAYDGSYRVKFI